MNSDNDFIAPEELATRFKSKKDLYYRMTYDRKHLTS